MAGLEILSQKNLILNAGTRKQEIKREIPGQIKLERTPHKDVVNFTSNIDKPDPLDKIKPATNLTEKVNIKDKDDNFTIISIPKKFIGNTTPNSYEIFSIIDGFTLEYKLGQSHGAWVQEFETHGLKDDVGVLAYDVWHPTNVDDALKDILDKKLNDPFYKAHLKKLNISRGQVSKLDYQDLSKLVGMEINESNISSLKEEIVEKLLAPKDTYIISKSECLDYYNVIKRINTLINLGVDVFVAAGNDGKGTLNIFSLSNAKVIGATDENGFVEGYSSESSLVSHHARGTYFLKYTYNENGEITGMTPFDDNIPFFTVEEFKKYPPTEIIKKYTGKIPDKLVNNELVKNGLQEFNCLTPLEEGKKFNDLQTKYNPKNGDLFHIDDYFYKLLAISKYDRMPDNTEIEQQIASFKQENSKFNAQYITYDKESKDWIHFSADTNGKLCPIFNKIEGTSFAAPTKLKIEYQKNQELN